MLWEIVVWGRCSLFSSAYTIVSTSLSERLSLTKMLMYVADWSTGHQCVIGCWRDVCRRHFIGLGLLDDEWEMESLRWLMLLLLRWLVWWV